MTRATVANPALRRGPDDRALLRLLRQQDTAYWGKTMGALCGGAILSFLGPLIAAIVVYSWIGDGGLGFGGLYRRCVLILLPIAYVTAYFTPGSVLESVVDGSDARIGRLRMTFILIAEIANIGPRLVLLGINFARSRSAVGRVNLPRTAEAVGVLWLAHGGISPAKLLHPGEPADVLEPMLALLILLQIADVSRNGDRVWLSSAVRDRVGPQTVQ